MADEIKSNTVKNITDQMKELVEVKDSFKAEQVTFMKNLINSDLTDTELYMFLVVASKAGLNPFNREIIAVVYNKNTPSERKVNYIVTRDGKRSVASRRGGVTSVVTEAIYTKSFRVSTGEKNEKGEDIYTDTNGMVKPWEGGKLWGAKSMVVRNGVSYEAIVPLSEYDTNKNVWATKPETMIKKVAESQALSQAVPELLGLYDETEMSAGSTQPAQEVPQLTDGADVLDKDDAMLVTLKVLGADVSRPWTKQEAMETIAKLNAEKGSRKPKVETPKA